MYEKAMIAKVFKDFCTVEKTQSNDVATVIKIKGAYSIDLIFSCGLCFYSKESNNAYYSFNWKKLKTCLDQNKDFKYFKDICLSFCSAVLPPYISETLLQENVAKWGHSVELDVNDILFLQDSITNFWDSAKSREDIKDSKVYSFLATILKAENFCKTYYDAMSVANKLTEDSKEFNEQFIFAINFLQVIYDDYLKDVSVLDL